jgi:hypothetical protein
MLLGNGHFFWLAICNSQIEKLKMQKTSCFLRFSVLGNLRKNRQILIHDPTKVGSQIYRRILNENYFHI